MSRKRTRLTIEQITELQVAYDRSRDGDSKIRVLAVRLYGTGMATADILELVTLPPAAPDLNPQEQVWTAARAAISHHHQVPRLPALADPFLSYLNRTLFPSTQYTVSNAGSGFPNRLLFSGMQTGLPIAQIIVAAANVRRRPGTNYGIAGFLYYGDTCLISGRNTDARWYLLECDTGLGIYGLVGCDRKPSRNSSDYN